MKILDTLRKLGILRIGAKAAVYRDAKSRPLEFMMDDVFDSEKDLVGKKPQQAKGRTWASGGISDD